MGMPHPPVPFPPTSFLVLSDILMCCSLRATHQVLTPSSPSAQDFASNCVAFSHLNNCDLGYHISARSSPKTVAHYSHVFSGLQDINLE